MKKMTKKETQENPFACLLKLNPEELDRVIDQSSRRFFAKQAKWLRPGGSYYDRPSKQGNA